MDERQPTLGKRISAAHARRHFAVARQAANDAVARRDKRALCRAIDEQVRAINALLGNVSAAARPGHDTDNQA